VGGPGSARHPSTAVLQSADLAPAARDIVEATGKALQRVGLYVPANRRWPIRVDFIKYAEHLRTDADTSLLHWISTLVAKRAVDELSPARLNSWLRLCPWAVIPDGLDQVPSSAARRELYLRIDTFIAQAEDVNPLLILTTRRTGCDERLAEPWFEHLCLDLMALGSARPPVRRAFSSCVAGLQLSTDEKAA
jgi:hypothetical protein